MKIYDIESMDKIVKCSKIFYDSPGFHILNQKKADSVIGFAFGDSKLRAYIMGGEIGGKLKFPYSSPFATIETCKNCTIEDLDVYVKELDGYAESKGIGSIQVKLPPLFYDETNISKMLSSLLRAGYGVDSIELNFQFVLRDMDYYMNSLYRNAKKNLNHAMKINWSLEHCDNDQTKRDAYEIVKMNRAHKGYNLAMSWEEVYATIKLVEHDFFILYKNDVAIASAIIFKVTEDVYQVVYWGDIPGYSEDRPINYLAYKLYDYYLKKGIRVLDIGPSMLDGHPNYGLCDFKESIGCEISSKFIMRKEFQ